MAKRPKCEHGNGAIKVQGCATCACMAMTGLSVCRHWDLKNHRELSMLLYVAYPGGIGSREFQEDIAKARHLIAGEDRKREFEQRRARHNTLI